MLSLKRSLCLCGLLIVMLQLTNAQLSVDPVEATLAEDTARHPPKGIVATAVEGLLFMPAFMASISMIIASEIGDKTFFIAAIMAMRHNRVTVFIGAIVALALMTVLSAAMGFALPNVLPRAYTHMASIALFVFFGFRLLKDAYYMEADGENDELVEVEEELEKKEIELSSTPMRDLESGTGNGATPSPSAAAKGGDTDTASVDHPSGKTKPNSLSALAQTFFSPVFIQSFTMTFLAEWGDRSQIATIALAASKNPYGVTLGGIIGHALCTSLAVIGGKMLASRISERTVAAVGGVLFLFFGVWGVITGE